MRKDRDEINITEENVEGLVDWLTNNTNLHESIDYMVRDASGNFSKELNNKEKILSNYLHMFYEMTIQMCARITVDRYRYRELDLTKADEYTKQMTKVYNEFVESAKNENDKHNYLFEIKSPNKMN